MQELVLPRPLATQLLFEAQKQPDIEVCGLVAAIDGTPTQLYPVANVAKDPAVSFRMDPQEQLTAMRQMRERREDLLAIYHSHPAAPPAPSHLDLEESGYPEAVLLIISLNIKGVLEMRAWQQDNKQVLELPLKVMV